MGFVTCISGQTTYITNSIQLVFSNLYLGIAWGALDTATAYTKKSTRAWPFGGDVSTNTFPLFLFLSN